MSRNARFAVTELDGQLFAGDVQITTASAYHKVGALLAPDVRAALGLTDHARLHRCDACGSTFVAHFAARLCSPECRAAARLHVEAKAAEKRRELHAWIMQNNKQCRHCGGPIEGARRVSRRSCSAACRQAAHRSRRKTLDEGARSSRPS